jgi:CRISPR-associated protein (TIGR03986 family)
VAEEGAVPLLGRCLPPPHDRYVGLTGHITCRLTATTPLFVSDSEGIQISSIGGKEHLSYRFFRSPDDDDNVAIPGSSLRGAFRSIFEALTNSCFSVFDGGRFDLREAKLPDDLVPVRVVEVDKDGAKLERLDCSSRRYLPRGATLHQRRGKTVPLMKAASVSAYEEQVLETKENIAFKPSKSLIDEKLKDGDRVAAVIDLKPVNHKVYQYFDVLEVTPAKKHRSLEVEAGREQKVFGYLHITGPNIEKKHLERVFFRWDDKRPEKPKWDAIPQAVRLEVSLETIGEYNEHLSRYWERHRRQLERLGKKPWPILAQALPHPSYFIEKDRRLRKGDLVYYVPQSKLAIPVLRPVLISRLPYKYDRAALLPAAHHACKEYNQLCPACRTFGWVWEAENEEEAEAAGKRVAYAGRVRFSLAQLRHDAGTFDATLAILSTPKPTTTRFYLAPKTGKPRDGRPDKEVGYDNEEQRLRGRKIYRHHGDQFSAQEYQSVGGKKSNQNRTVRGVQEEGSVFEFELSFENLASVELGALLWTLELEAGMNHRLGYGKPLGFGSARVEIQGLKLLNTATCYASLSASQWVNGLAYKDEWIGEFKAAMKERFGQVFKQLPNVADLEQLMREPPALPIHYPRPTPRPHPDGKNYEWFVGNKQSGKRSGPKLVLPKATDEGQGLPLVNRSGQVIRLG